MDNESISQLELQALYFWPFYPIEFCSKLKHISTKAAKAAIIELRNVASSIQSSEIEPSQEQIDDDITSLETRMFNTFATVTENLLANLEQLTYIPNNISFEELSLEPEGPLIYDDEFARYEQLKQEVMEQEIMKAKLNQEIQEYEQMESIFAKGEQLIDKLRMLPQMEVPSAVIEMINDSIEKRDEHILSILAKTPNFH